jgi:hypothetical protein
MTRLARLVPIAIVAAACAREPERSWVVVCEIDATSRGEPPDRARLLGASGFERRHTLQAPQADLLAKTAARGGKLLGFELNLFLGGFGEPALVEALQRGPLRLRIDRMLLDRAKSGSAAGAEVRLRIGPASHFENLDVDLP